MGGEDTKMRALTKRPEKDPLLDDVDSLNCEEIDACLYAHHRGKRFEDTDNPVFAMEAFLIAQEQGLYPPGWVLDWLAKGFGQYHKEKGREPLEQCLGFPQGRGITPAFKSVLQGDRDEMVLFDVYRLRCLLDITIEEAAGCVAERLKREDWDQTGHNLGDLSKVTIADRYKRGYGRKMEDEEDRHSPCDWPDDEKAKFLSHFGLEFAPQKKDEITRLLSMAWR